MVDPITSRRVMHMGLYLAIVLLLLFLRLLPTNPVSTGIPGPDLTVALTIAWVMRRPDYVPALLIVAVFLLEDLMLWRPIGLWTLIVLFGTEFLRAREEGSRDLPFALEMALVGGVMVAMQVLDRFVLGLLMVDQPPLGRELLRMLMTLIAYPFVVAFSALAFGLRRPATGEVDDFGRPI
ncbi:rod shape-determining protein MreD [Rhodobacter sp. JA431]|uniref:rod shape-determining protein MreD n=1 Tax=Rhodobacter sp. JA431 TaxID=570013 RepID=UPI000BD3EA14|nr:rod shape-determining protein MreD [Rhodobacter sp. JA431]SOB89668.1 rod shape-determining protein MreD [Rhodobacter sp. JA431]